MSFFVLITGVLVNDPQQRVGASGKPFTIALVRAGDGEDAVLASVIAFGDAASALLDFSKGYPVSLSERARLSSWTGRDGEQRHGLSLTISQLIGLDQPRLSRRRDSSNSPTTQPWRAKRRAGARTAAPGDIPDDRVDDLWEPAP